MIVVTTPTGHIGSELVTRLLDGEDPVRVIVRHASRLDPGLRERIEIIEGSHCDLAALDRALPQAEALFWLVPPNPQAPSAMAHYLHFAQAGAAAVRRHGVGHVVGISSAGHGWPESAGLLSAAFAMDAELERSGAAYRALSMPFYMENLLGQLDTIHEQGAFSLTYPPDQPLASIATRDVAQTAAALLTNRSWTGQDNLPVFGPDWLTPNDMAEVIADVLGRPVAYRQTGMEDFAAIIAQRGGSEQTVRDLSEMLIAQANGLYDLDWASATRTPTGFRTWCEEVLRPAMSA